MVNGMLKKSRVASASFPYFYFPVSARGVKSKIAIGVYFIDALNLFINFGFFEAPLVNIALQRLCLHIVGSSLRTCSISLPFQWQPYDLPQTEYWAVKVLELQEKQRIQLLPRHLHVDWQAQRPEVALEDKSQLVVANRL